MINLRAIHRRIAKFTKEDLKPQFEAIEKKLGESVFNQTKALLYIAVNPEAPSGENKQLLEDLLEIYAGLPEYKQLVDTCLADLAQRFKGEQMQLPNNQVVSCAEYFKETYKQLQSNSIDFEKRNQNSLASKKIGAEEKSF